MAAKNLIFEDIGSDAAPYLMTFGLDIGAQADIWTDADPAAGVWADRSEATGTWVTSNPQSGSWTDA
jgi:hypothetical protein